jgi:transketolase
MDAKQLHDLGQQLRVDAVRATAAAGSGHPTSSMSAADLMAVLLAEHLRYDFTMPAPAAVGGRRHRLARTRPAGGRGHGAGCHPAGAQHLPRVGAVRGQRTPTAIIARTMKGRGVAAVQDAEGAHGKPLPGADEAIAELGRIHNIGVPAGDKPVDTQVLRAAADTGGFVTVEDHWPEGGLGDAVLAAFANGHQAPRLTKLAVHVMPGSATPAEQLHAAGIDAKAIEAAAHALAGDRVASG